MNMRNLIKLQRVNIDDKVIRDYDNPYEYKLEIWHGTEDAPYHEAVYFTQAEIKSFLTNIMKVQKEVRKALNGRATDRKDNVL